MPPNDHELLVRIDERTGRLQEDMDAVKNSIADLNDRWQTDHDRLVIFQGEVGKIVEKLDGKITNTRIGQSIVTIIGTALGVLLGPFKK